MSHTNQPKLRGLNIPDLIEAAKIHKKSFPNSLLAIVGEESIVRYYTWQFKSRAKIYPIGIYINEKLVGYCIGGVFRAALGGFLARNKLFLGLQVLKNPSIFLNTKFLKNILYILRLSIYFSFKNKIPKNPNENKSVNYFGILAIAVDPKHSNNGYGKILISESEKYASRNGFTHMRLTADIENTRTIQFYKTNGWKKNMSENNWRGKMIKKI